MSESETAREQYELYQYCRVEGGHENFLHGFDQAKRYYASRHWSDADVRRRTSEGRLSFTINEIFRTINAVSGEMAQLSSDVRYDATTGDPDTARVLNRLSEHVDRQNKLFMHDDRVRRDGLLGGRGFWRVRVAFDENLQGNIVIARQRPENTILDANLYSPDPDTWDRIFTTEVVSAADIKHMFGKNVTGDLFEMPMADWLDLEDRTLAQSLGKVSASFGDHMGASKAGGFKMHRLVNHQYRDYKYKECFVDRQTGDISEIPENWSDEKIGNAIEMFNLGTMRRKIKTIRWRVTCNNRVLFDEDSPYKHFDIVPYLPWFVDGEALSLFDVLKGPQDLLNYTVSEETLILGATAHAGWKVKAGSLQNMTPAQLETKGSKTGVVLVLDDVEDAKRIEPGQPATGFERFGDRARSWINDLGSVSPTMLGAGGNYDTGKKAQLNLSRAPVNLHAPLQMFQYSKQLLAERKLDLFQSFYTETRVLRIAPAGFGPPEEVAINQPTPEGRLLHDLSAGKYSARLMPVGSRMAADEFAFDELLQMREIGINVPNSLFVATSSINAKSEVIEQLLAANGGETNPAEERAKELELEALELENEKTRALSDAASGAGELARSRARKVDVDASFDPRTARAGLDERRLQSEHERDLRRQEAEERRDARSTAVKLTQIATAAAKPPPKPAGAVPKKTAKKTAKKAAKKTPKKQPR